MKHSMSFLTRGLLRATVTSIAVGALLVGTASVALADPPAGGTGGTSTPAPAPTPDAGSVAATAAGETGKLAMEKASEAIDEAIKCVGEQAAREGWYDDATRARLTRAGAASGGLKVAGGALTVAGVAAGIHRATTTSDPAEQARGCLDAAWSAVPGPHGLAGSIGNAIGQEIEKIDTGVPTADGGSTVHDWLTAAVGEYVEHGFVKTFVGGWKGILGID